MHSRAPRGARGLKSQIKAPVDADGYGRAPRGARGLKFAPVMDNLYLDTSCPSRGTWIEISARHHSAAELKSCPSRGTWIEMSLSKCWTDSSGVVPLAGHVD